MADKDHDEVGYGKPPKYRQFRKGQSGNPKGRPKKQISLLRSIYETCGSRRVKITIDGRQRTVTMLEALVYQHHANAQKNPRILNDLMKLYNTFPTPRTITREDIVEAIEDMKRRLRDRGIDPDQIKKDKT